MSKKITSVVLSFLLCFCFLHDLQVSAAVHKYHRSLTNPSDSSQTSLVQTEQENKGIEIDGVGLGKACISALMNTIPPDFCWRSIEGTPNVCPPGHSRVGIVCHKNGSIFGFSMASCPAGSVKLLAFCHKDCNNVGLTSCGPLACASSTGACVSSIVSMILQVAEGVITGVAFVLSFGASAPATVAAKTAVKAATDKAGDAAIRGIANNLKKKLTGQLGARIKEGALANIKTKVKGLIKEAGKEIAQNLAEVVAMNFCQPIFDSMMGKSASSTAEVVGAQLVSAIDILNIKGTYDACKDTSKDKGLSCAQNILTGLSLFDPTGLLTIAAAFMQPKCPDPFPTLSSQDKTNLNAAAASGSSSSSPSQVNVGGDVINFSKNFGATSKWISQNGKNAAVFQDDGNFVVYCGDKPIWASDTWNKGKTLVTQSDGNMVIYDAGGKATWHSSTWGANSNGLYVRVQNDGNLVMYDASNNVKWATNKFCPVTPPPTPTTNDVFRVGTYAATQRWTSQDGQKVAVFQDDGNFVVYCRDKPIWASGTWNKGKKLILQDDGNMVIYDAGGKATWHSSTWGVDSNGLYVRMQNDGNLVMYDRNNTPRWASGNRC